MKITGRARPAAEPATPATKGRPPGKKGKTQRHPWVDVLVIEAKSGKWRWERRWVDSGPKKV